MECEHCGAQMVMLPNHGYLFCEYCGSFYFPKAALKKIAKGEDIDVVITKPGDLQCPACRHRLSEALIDDDYPTWRCKRCKGILTNQEVFWEIVKHRRGTFEGRPDRPQPLNRDELKRKIACPQCGKMMETHPYYGPGQFVIQTCRFCQVIWLDYGEFRKAIRAPGQDLRWW